MLICVSEVALQRVSSSSYFFFFFVSFSFFSIFQLIHITLIIINSTYPIGVLLPNPSADPHFFILFDDDPLPNDAVLLLVSGVLGTLCDLARGDTSFMDGLEGKGELLRKPD